MADQALPKRSEDFSAWYNEVIYKAELADHSPVRGCMVIRPYGYAIWEQMQKQLDLMIKDTGHLNAYFPLLIPESFLKKEAQHVEGFAPELAVVTHGGGKKLEEPLVIRPTSETIMYHMYAKWIQSHRDLPLLLNQWANVIRWEMRTRPFLRTTEFLWQEGHTAHATEAEAEEEAKKMLGVYATFSRDHLAIPVVPGLKSDAEKFAGALRSYCVEALMQDGKAIQMGTSHQLGQNFSKAFDITFQTESGGREHVWQTSWGVSTRMIGALVMAHGDDKGLMMPPTIAPYQVVVVPIQKTDAERATVAAALQPLVQQWKSALRVHVDDRAQYSPGWKYHEWELRGVPVRVELGPRDIASRQVVVARRDTGEKKPLPWDGSLGALQALLQDIQSSMSQRASAFTAQHTTVADSYEALKAALNSPGGFVKAFRCGERVCEKAVQEETKATLRVIPFETQAEVGTCVRCGKPSAGDGRVLFALAY